jgi:hypothetical protein
MCIPLIIARQRLGTHVPAATNTSKHGGTGGSASLCIPLQFIDRNSVRIFLLQRRFVERVFCTRLAPYKRKVDWKLRLGKMKTLMPFRSEFWGECLSLWEKLQERRQLDNVEFRMFVIGPLSCVNYWHNYVLDIFYSILHSINIDCWRCVANWSNGL